MDRFKLKSQFPYLEIIKGNLIQVRVKTLKAAHRETFYSTSRPRGPPRPSCLCLDHNLNLKGAALRGLPAREGCLAYGLRWDMSDRDSDSAELGLVCGDTGWVGFKLVRRNNGGEKTSRT